MAEVEVSEDGAVALAWIGARRGVTDDALQAAAAGDLAAPPWLPIGPGTWLARRAENAGGDWCGQLAGRLVGLASVTDQTGAYHAFRFGGAGARTLLQRGASIDFGPAAFPRGAVASTVIAHIAAIVVCIESAGTYDVFVYRSFAGSFRRWIEHALAGLDA